jgi:hypothetical protein
LDIKRTPGLFEEVDEKEKKKNEAREYEQTIFVAYMDNEEWRMNGLTVSLKCGIGRRLRKAMENLK